MSFFLKRDSSRIDAGLPATNSAQRILTEAIILAGIRASMTGSYLVFFVALAGLIVGNVMAGKIARGSARDTCH
jgi:hypothetical protein